MSCDNDHNKKTKTYRAFCITAVIVAMINLANMNKFNVAPGVPILLTAFAVGYCLLMPRINLLTASLVWIGLAIGNALFLPFGQMSTSPAIELVAGIWGLLVYALAAPMFAGLIAHGIALLAGGSHESPAQQNPESVCSKLKKAASENRAIEDNRERTVGDDRRWAPPGYSEHH